MPAPYDYVRVITITLGTIWSVRALVRLTRFTMDWYLKLQPLGLDKRWMRRRVVRLVLRTTVLDPINLALLLTLVGSWMVRGWFVD